MPSLFPGVTKLQRSYMLHCPPSYILVAPHRRPCQRTRPCPLCHARQDGDAWDDMYEMAFGQRPSSRPDSDDHDVVSYKSLRNALIRTLAYPISLLRSPDRAATAQLLQALQQSRMRALPSKQNDE